MARIYTATINEKTPAYFTGCTAGVKKILELLLCAETQRQVLHELPCYVKTKYIATDQEKWILQTWKDREEFYE